MTTTTCNGTHTHDPMLDPDTCYRCGADLTMTPKQRARMTAPSQQELDDLSHGALHRPSNN